MTQQQSRLLAKKILFALLAGLLVGLFLNYFMPFGSEQKNLASAEQHWVYYYLADGIFHIGGQIFISVMMMVVVPIVFISLVYGTSNLGDSRTLGRLCGKTLLYYLGTTFFAISIGLFFAHLFNVGYGASLETTTVFVPPITPSFSKVLINIIPVNPIAAMTQPDKILQVIVFSILLGMAIAFSGEAGESIKKLVGDLNTIIMRLIMMLMQAAPFGVFCLIAEIASKQGPDAFVQLFKFVIVVLFVLVLHLLITNSFLLKVIGKLNPKIFFHKIYPAMIFAFSTSSSNASIPVVLESTEKKLGAQNRIASFTVPLGATINMNGTAIMQGIATVFVAQAYGIELTFTNYIMVILTATLASIGTAGVPAAGTIMLFVIFQSVGLPIEGVALIMGVERILDMARTAVNVTGDAVITCLVAKSENALDEKIYNTHPNKL